jgi:Sec-independent protein translocase protein TatA
MTLGGGELIVVMLALLILFGPKDAPRILRGIQNVLNKLQRATADLRYKMMYEDLHLNQPAEPNDTAKNTEEEVPASLSDYPPEDASDHEKPV